MKKKVIFICTHNSARSQIAEGIMKHYLKDKYEVYSAGTFPTQINPLAILVLKEIGIDISDQYSKNVRLFINDFFDYVITVCDNARENCPIFSNGKYILHKSFNDPTQIIGDQQTKLEAFREVRDQIKEWILKNF